MTPQPSEQPRTAAGGFDIRTLTPDQRSLADDIASAMSFGHEDGCAVWWEDPDGCSCPLLMDVAGGLHGARIVEVVQELGYDPATQRGDRLQRQMFDPHPLTEAAAPDRVSPTGDAMPMRMRTALSAFEAWAAAVIPMRRWSAPDPVASPLTAERSAKALALIVIRDRQAHDRIERDNRWTLPDPLWMSLDDDQRIGWRVLAREYARLAAAPDPVASPAPAHGVAVFGDYGVTCSCTEVLSWPLGWSRTTAAAENLVKKHATPAVASPAPRDAPHEHQWVAVGTERNFGGGIGWVIQSCVCGEIRRVALP